MMWSLWKVFILFSTPPNPCHRDGRVTHMEAASDQSPRIAMVLQSGQAVQETMRESLENLCGPVLSSLNSKPRMASS